MEENKKELGTVTVEVNGKEEKWNFASMLVANFKGDRRVVVGKTDHDTYTLTVRKPDDNGKVIEQGMHLTKESLAALTNSILLFLDKDGEDGEAFVTCCKDDDSGYLYKRAGEEG